MLCKYEHITVKHVICAFEELDNDAKWRVQADNTENFIYDDMKNLLELDVDPYFPNSEIEAEYDFSACQGSGLNLYGNFSLNDLVHYATGHYLDNDEADNILVKMPHNSRCTYCLWNITYPELIEWALQEYFDEYGPETDTTESLTPVIVDKMRDLCDSLYTEGQEQIECYGSPEFNEDSMFTPSGEWACYCWDTSDYCEMEV